MDDGRPLLPFVAIATTNDKNELKVEASFCTQLDDRAYLAFVNQKLASVDEVGYCLFVVGLDCVRMFFVLYCIWSRVDWLAWLAWLVDR